MNYKKFAFLYDGLMLDAPYDQWVSFVIQAVKKYGNGNGELLDVACGTGNVAIPLVKQGFSVTAVDLSEEMLLVAKEKCEETGAKLPLFQQDMRELEALGTFDTVICLCDSLNYLVVEEDIFLAFEKMYEHLNKNGLLIFDVHSIHKIDEVFKDHTFAYNGEQISYIWECFSGDVSHSVEHELSFFVVNEQGLYERYDELHKQRTFPSSFYEKALAKVGFELISVTGDFSLDQLSDDAERWFFVAKK